MSKYVLGVYEKAMPNTLSFEEKLRYAKEIGYDYLEISIDETPEKLSRLDWDKKTRDELVSTMKKVGLPIRSLCLSGQRKYPMGSENEEIRKQSMEIIEKAIILADDLGVRIIQLAGYDVYYENFEMYYKVEGQTQWNQDKYGIKNYEIPVGIHRDAVSYFRTIKDQFTITEDEETITIHFQNSDLKFLDANSDLLIKPANNRFSFSKDHENGELNMDLTVSKEDYTPLSITITCTGRSSNLAKYTMVSKVTYSNINSGISVEAPNGIENAIED